MFLLILKEKLCKQEGQHVSHLSFGTIQEKSVLLKSRNHQDRSGKKGNLILKSYIIENILILIYWNDTNILLNKY